MKKVYVLSHSAGDACFYYRTQIPFTNLTEKGYSVIVHYDRISKTALEEADIVSFHRTYLRTHTTAMWYAKKMGKKVVYETDDNYLAIPPYNPATITIGPHTDDIEHQLKMADIVTVSTVPLKKSLSEFNSNIAVLPNCFEPKYGKVDLNGVRISTHPDDTEISVAEATSRCQGRQVICWAGSETHKQDLELIAPVLSKIAKDFPNTMFVFFGYCLSSILNSIPAHQILRVGFAPFRKYLTLLESFNGMIGLAPLVDNKFNICKSNVKVLEYYRAGMIPVVSRIEPYNSYGMDGGIVCRPNEWEDSLRSILSESTPDKIKVWREKLDPYINSFDITKNIDTWKSIYELLS